MDTETRVWFEEQRANFTAKKQAGIDLLNAHRAQFGNDALVLVYDQPEVERRPWYAIVLLPSTRQPGKVQRSTFDTYGFSGHETFDTYEEAAADAYLSGFRRADPDLLDRIALTDEFEAGTRWTMLPEDQRWNISIAEILQQIKNEKS